MPSMKTSGKSAVIEWTMKQILTELRPPELIDIEHEIPSVTSLIENGLSEREAQVHHNRLRLYRYLSRMRYLRKRAKTMFENALTFTMQYEVGPWFKLDDETRAGKCDTPAQKRKTGYVNDPADAGGETKFGIAKNSNTSVNIKTLTWDQCSSIYRKKYWDPLSLDKVPDNVATVIFDCSVNHGPGTAAKFLQGAVGAAEDGQIGPKTLALVNSKSADDIVRKVLDRRRAFFRNIVANKPSQAKFINGWLARCDSLQKQLGV